MAKLIYYQPHEVDDEEDQGRIDGQLEDDTDGPCRRIDVERPACRPAMMHAEREKRKRGGDGADGDGERDVMGFALHMRVTHHIAG